MKRKIYKIGLSLLITAFFMLSSVSAVGWSPAGEGDAGDTEIIEANISNAERDIDGRRSIEKISPDTPYVSMDDDGCWPVDVTALSLDGEWIADDDIFPTGTYPIDIEVCKTEWCYDCVTNWQVIDIDDVLEGLDMTDPRPMTPVIIETKCDLDNVYFRFTSEGMLPTGGDYYNVGDTTIWIQGDLGSRIYTTTMADPTVLYWGVAPIPGAIVTRSGGYGTQTPYVIEIQLPRTGYWSDCCEEVEWWYGIYNAGNPLNYNWNGWYEDPCMCDIYPAEVKKFVEIYRYRTEEDPDQTEEIYCNNFEDPCTIYTDFSTLDMPVFGYNGALDTWTWSDSRACEGEHAMHSTSFDQYLENQWDILKLGFGGAGLDVSKYDEIEICWQQFIEGDFVTLSDGTILIQDYGYFEYSFDDTVWTQAGPLYYDSLGVCEDICEIIDLDKASALDDTIYFRWVFKSDPAFCYEGYIIDDICIEGTIEGSFEEWWEFVMDSHSWPQIIEGECETYVFPEEWTVEEEGIYKICGWLEALDECHYSSTPYDDPYCVIIEIGNVLDLELDCGTLAMSPSSPAWEGDDVAISVDMCNVGTLDAEDVQVKMTVRRGSYSISRTDNVEGSGQCALVSDVDAYDHWAQSGLVGRSNMHFTTYDSTVGSTSIANFYEDTGFPYRYKYNGYTSEYVRSPAYYVHTDKDLGITATVDVKYSLGTGEAIRFTVWEYETGWNWGYTGGDGAYSAWRLEDFDISDAIANLESYVLADLLILGKDLTDARYGVGFIMYKDGSDFDNPANPDNAEWSGFMIDNFVETSLVAEPGIIFDQTKVIPDLDSGLCTTVDFLWENAGVGNYIIDVEILTADANPDNNACLQAYQVINVMEEIDFDECVDYTGQGDGHWNNEGCCENYLWAGDPATTIYGNDWNDCLYFVDPADGDITFDHSAYAGVTITYDTWFELAMNDYGYMEVSMDGGETFMSTSGIYVGDSAAVMGADVFGWFTEILSGPCNDEMQYRFRFESNATEEARGWFVDTVTMYETADPSNVLFGPTKDMADFHATELSYGCWWQEPCIHQYFGFDAPPFIDSKYYWSGDLEPSNGVYDQDIFALSRPWTGAAPDNLDTAVTATLPVPKCFFGWVESTFYYDTDAGDIVTIDISRNGVDWDNLDFWQGSANDDYQGGALNLATVIWNDYMYWGDTYADITDYLDETELQFRLRYQSDSVNLHTYAGVGTLFGTYFYGMADYNAPVTQAIVDGIFDSTYHYYTSSVKIKLTATDDLTGVAKTYYKLDGVTHEYVGIVTIDTDGDHTFCYWSEDLEGNVEAEQCISFRIDISGPQVTITGPQPGIYLFGNKLIDSDKYIFLFGGITITADVIIDGAPLVGVEFYLDDVFFGADNTAPYSLKCSEKHSGTAEFKVIATDILGRTSEDTLTVDTYFKLF